MENWALLELRNSRVGKAIVPGISKLLLNLHSMPGASFSVAAGNAVRQTFGRLDAGSKTTRYEPEDIFAGHTSQTAIRCKHYLENDDTILVIQDTTHMDYTNLNKVQDLGGCNSTKDKAIFGHSALAVGANGTLLGILHLELWTRDNEQFGKAANRRQLHIEDKESYRWISTHEACEKQLPANASVIYVSDREADIFPYLARPRTAGSHLLVRANRPRRVEIASPPGDQERALLFDAISQSQVRGSVIVDVPRSANRENSKINLEVQYEKMRFLPPVNNLDAGKDSLEIWVIRARETCPPEGETAIEWVLNTTKQINSLQEAIQMVGFYSKRWLIERFHYTLKSGGCNVEKLQMETARALKLAITAYYIVAWRILQTTYAIRLTPQAPAGEILSPIEIRILERLHKKPVKTCRDVMNAVGKLAGYEHYEGGRPAGVKKLWNGFRELGILVKGYYIAIDINIPIQD